MMRGDRAGTRARRRVYRRTAAPADGGEEDEHEAWAAAAAVEAEADVDRAWEDAYQREMMMEEEAMTAADAFGDG